MAKRVWKAGVVTIVLAAAALVSAVLAECYGLAASRQTKKPASAEFARPPVCGARDRPR